MKQNLFLLLSIGILAGCAISTKSHTYVPTVSSDLYPTEMSRDQYYEELGKAYAKDQQPERAIDEFRLALLHNSNRLSTRVYLSNEYRKMGMDQLAANELTEVLRLEPKNTDALLRLGDLYLSAQIYGKSKQIFTRILELEPKNDQALWLLFYVARLENNDQDAKKYLSELSITDSNKIKILYEKALLAKRQSRFEEYSELIQSAYALEPHNKNICVELANEFVEKADFDSARLVLNRYTQAHDFDLDVSQSLVYVAVRSEQYEVALNELEHQRLAGLSPSEVELKKAHVYFLAGDLVAAEQGYQFVLQQNANQDQARFYLGQIYAYQNSVDLAKDAFSQLTAASTYFAEAQVWLASEDVKKNQSQSALQRLEKAQAQRPDQLPLYTAYADLLIREKKYKKALRILQSGSEFFPQNEDLHIQAAIAHFRLGHDVQFKKSIDQAIAINPENADIYSSLAELWYLKKLNPKDIEIFAQKALAFNTKNKNMKPLLAWALMAQDRSLGSVALFEKFYEENPKQPFYAEALSKVYRAADIAGKAERMNAQAQKLHNQKRLQSDLVFGSQRQPASLKTPSN